MAVIERADGVAAPEDGLADRPPPWYRLELPAVLLGAVALAVASGWQHLRHLTTALPLDPDPQYFAWQMAWVSHAAWASPRALWTSPAYDRLPDNLALTDAVLGYAPLGWLTSALFGGGPAAAVAQLNLAMLISSVVAFGGAYALARVLGSRVSGALLAGAAFSLTPWRLVQVNHINVISYGGIALALALLCRGHGWSRDGLRPERISPGWVFAGWLVAAWQMTMGFAVGIFFSYVLAGCVLVLGTRVVLRLRRATPWRLMVADVAGAAVFLAVTAWLMRPFLRIVERFPAGARTEVQLELFSPRWRGFFMPPVTSEWFGDRFTTARLALGFTGETLAPPGIVLIAVALLGLVVSTWPLRRRIWLGAAVTVAVVLAFGVHFPGHGEWTFLPLWDTLPGWNATRTPGRLVLWAILGLCLLAAGAVSALEERLRRDADRRGPALAALVALALVVPAGAAAAEGWPKDPFPLVPVPEEPAAVTGAAPKLLFLPSWSGAYEYRRLLWATDGWPRTLNGSGSFDLPQMLELRVKTATFPDVRSVKYLRARGVRTVIILRGQPISNAEDDMIVRPVDGLGIRRTDVGSYVRYDLSPRGTRTG